MGEQWEMCEIKLRPSGFLALIGARRVRFVAVAMGPYGTNEIARTRRFLGYGRGRKQEAAVQRMAADLTAQGWEPLGAGTRLPWWGYRFRHRIR